LVLSSVTISSLFNFSLYAQQGGAVIDGSAPCYGNTAIAMAGLLLVEQLQVQKIQVDQLLVLAQRHHLLQKRLMDSQFIQAENLEYG
jgi:hypothetical protein